MKDEWRAFKLDQLGFVGRGRSRHRPRNDPSLYGGQYPFFQTGDVKAAELYLHQHEATYNELGLAQSKLWQPGTLCITIAANIAESAILAIPGCFPDSVVGFVSDPKAADTEFVKYKLDTLKLAMQSASLGTTQDNLSLDKLLRFDFLVPALPTQQRIAAILSAYDDLIENNTRRIAILEEMARRLYEEWFVHFRFPGHEEVEFVGEGDDRHPAGWQLGLLFDFIELKYGKALKASERVEGPFPVYGSSGVVGSHNQSLVEGPGIIVGRKGNVGSVFWSDEPFYPIDTVYFVQTALPLEYVFFNLRRQNFLNNDAAVPGLNRQQAYSLPFLRPPNELLCRFVDVCTPLFAAHRLLCRQNANLRAQRDLLLPKLVSGEIDVSEAEAELEAAE